MMIGISSIQLFSYGTLNDLVSFMNEHKLRYIDIFLIPPYLSGENIFNITKRLKEEISEIQFTLRAPSFSENLASILKDVRELTFKEFAESIELAHKIGARAVIIKPGMMFHTEKRFKDRIIKRVIESILSLADSASQYGLTLLLENYYYPYEILRRAESFSYMYEFFSDYRNIGFALNIPHLLESRSSIDFLSRNCNENILKRVKLVYLGVRPSPWEKSDYIQSVTHSYYEFIKLYKVRKPDYVVVASINEAVAKLLIDYLRELI